jgi:hypothetical protein
LASFQEKAAGDCRTPRRYRDFQASSEFREVFGFAILYPLSSVRAAVSLRVACLARVFLEPWRNSIGKNLNFMHSHHRLSFLASIVVAVTLCSCTTPQSGEKAGPNQLSAREKRQGWKLLFDGKSLAGWRSYGKPNSPNHGWEVKDGMLNCIANAHGGDIVSTEQFTDFDLQWDWMIPPKANNGIKYLVSEKRPKAPGHEYQMIDDAIVADSPRQSTASFYDVLAPDPSKPLNPPGQWNHSRVLVKGNRVEHWLNGRKVLEYELGSAEIKKAIAKSKFKNFPDFADKITGPILLTEHHDAASFKNIKILVLK